MFSQTCCRRLEMGEGSGIASGTRRRRSSVERVWARPFVVIIHRFFFDGRADGEERRINK
jgi:hypothetical protein